MTFYQLRPERAQHQPAFQIGQRYRFLEPTYPPGYIFLELGGKPRCVWADDFSKVTTGSRFRPARSLQDPDHPIRRLK